MLMLLSMLFAAVFDLQCDDEIEEEITGHDGEIEEITGHGSSIVI